jgi:ankyrin repeat protein
MNKINACDSIVFELVRKKETDQVKQMLALGVNPNSMDVINGLSLLSCAVEAQSTSIVEALISYGANNDIHNSTDSSPLGLALLAGYIDIANLLFSNGFKLSKSEIETGIIEEAISIGEPQKKIAELITNCMVK